MKNVWVGDGGGIRVGMGVGGKEKRLTFFNKWFLNNAY